MARPQLTTVDTSTETPCVAPLTPAPARAFPCSTAVSTASRSRASPPSPCVSTPSAGRSGPFKTRPPSTSRARPSRPPGSLCATRSCASNMSAAISRMPADSPASPSANSPPAPAPSPPPAPIFLPTASGSSAPPSPAPIAQTVPPASSSPTITRTRWRCAPTIISTAPSASTSTGARTSTPRST